MTWIIGSTALCGSASLVSDICVTFTEADGVQRHIDCLQKIYFLGPSIIGGFSGSVRIGFDIFEILQREFSNGPPGAALDMSIAAQTWLPRVIRRVFLSAPGTEQRLGSSIILASAHPTKNRGEAPWAWTDVHILSSPNFAPVVAASREAVAIGKGSSVPAYMDAIRALSSDVGFVSASMSSQDIQASLLAHMVSTSISNGSVPGVSTMFQFGLITRNQYTIHDHKYTISQPDGQNI